MIEVCHIGEPELEFGGGGRHLDIRFGLMDYGPFDLTHSEAPRRIRIGIVGSAATGDGVARWIERCRAGLPAKASRQPNLFPAFPGLGSDGVFRSEFVTSAEFQRMLTQRELLRLATIGDANCATRETAAAFLDEIRALAEQNVPPDVVLCALPLDVIEATVNAPSDEDDEDEDQKDEGDALNLRGMLKAACMELRLPIQILWPTTYDPAIRIPRKLKKASERRVQDDATRAWNFFTALYYKANGLPWRLVRDPKQLKTSYIGISFYRTTDRDLVHSSSAQMFDERGEGLILRGARIAGGPTAAPRCRRRVQAALGLARRLPPAAWPFPGAGRVAQDVHLRCGRARWIQQGAQRARHRLCRLHLCVEDIHAPLSHGRLSTIARNLNAAG
jgi:hypothetical protein